MKKLLLIVVCCFCLCGCGNKNSIITKASHKTLCSTDSNTLIDNNFILRSSEDNSYSFNTISEAIAVEKELTETCNNIKTDYIKCQVNRNGEWVYFYTDVTCNNIEDCSYEKLINNYESKNMNCEEDVLK